MTHGSLFSGIGGFDLAAEWAGWDNVFHCECDQFAQKVLKHHFPNSKLYNDIRTFDATDYFGRIDIITGGFPCQPFSAAGNRKGTEDERHLWPEMLRIIREVSPKYVVGENVRGLVNWSGGLVFEQVCADLEAEGYEVLPLLLPAVGVNAPHRRDRIWFIAYTDGVRNTPPPTSGEIKTKECKGLARKEKGRSGGEWSNGLSRFSRDVANTNTRLCYTKDKEVCTRGNTPDDGSQRNAPHTYDVLSEGRDGSRENGRGEQKKRAEPFGQPRGWEKFPSVAPVCGRDDGIPRELDSITFSKWRRESIKAYGNAIVPQVVYEIFKVINKMENGLLL